MSRRGICPARGYPLMAHVIPMPQEGEPRGKCLTCGAVFVQKEERSDES